MSWFTGLVVFLIVWWILLFTVLPFWIKSVDKTEDAGISGGAPETPNLKKKFLVTTGLSAIIWLVIFISVQTNLIDFHSISIQMFEDDYK